VLPLGRNPLRYVGAVAQPLVEGEDAAQEARWIR
jgi:hypothetical protein